MKTHIFQYLRRKNLTDVDKVNSLFVTAFVTVNGWEVKNNRLLLRYINPEDNSLSDIIRQLVKSECVFTLEDLAKLFEFVISPEDRVVTGAVYTPIDIRTLIINQVLQKTKGKRIDAIRVGDISCGCGGFLTDVAAVIHKETGKAYALIFKEQLYGVDIADYAVERTKIMLSLLAISEGEDYDFEFNVFQGDSVTFDFSKLGKFDIVIGNPPYVCSRNMMASTKESLSRWSVSNSGHPDLYIPFFQIALENIKDEGVLGYITMNSFIKSLNGKCLRQYFQESKFDFSLIDFRDRQVFGSKSTYTCICIIKKSPSTTIDYGINTDEPFLNLPVFSKVSYSDLSVEKGWNLDRHGSNQFLESIGTPLGKYCQSRHGIATLSNKTFIFDIKREDEAFFFFEKNGKEYKAERGICRDIVNSNRMTKEIKLEDVVEKAIFPYTDDEHPTIMDEQMFRTRYPFAYEYLWEQRETLFKRDKGKGRNYAYWYEYGRTQCLEKIPVKLFFPKLACRPPQCVLSTDANMLFYNGQAFIGSDVNKLMIVKRIIESEVFWSYITSSSKPYCSNYFCLNGNYIKHFGVCDFSDDEIKYLIEEPNKSKIELFLKEKYYHY